MVNISWFKIELYTATPGELTDYFRVPIQKITILKNNGGLVLGNKYNLGSRIDLAEGTTRYINIDCIDSDGSLYDLEDYTATVVIKFDNDPLIVKDYTIDDNTITFTIDPEDSVGKRSGLYEVRIYKNDEIYRVIKGDIGINSAIRPFLLDQN